MRYGFLSKRADFAQAVQYAELVFIGPDPAWIAAMGNKSAAKLRMIAVGVPRVLGYQGDEQADEVRASQALKVGLPAMMDAPRSWCMGHALWSPASSRLALGRATSSAVSRCWMNYAMAAFNAQQVIDPRHTRNTLIRLIEIHRPQPTAGVGEQLMRAWPTSL